MSEVVQKIVDDYALIWAFGFIGLVIWVSYEFSSRLVGGRVHGSAIALMIGLALAYWGGSVTGGSQGLADLPLFAGIGLMGGAMFRDLAITATAFGVKLEEVKKAGVRGAVSVLAGVGVSFVVGAAVAAVFGYRDAVSMATIGGGAATYIVGTVTGAALGADSNVIALSVATGVVKAIVVMMATPFLAKAIGLDNPRSALVFGGLLGTTSGVVAGLMATNPKLIPYAALTATFYTGIGCILGPSVVYYVLSLIP